MAESELHQHRLHQHGVECGNEERPGVAVRMTSAPIRWYQTARQDRSSPCRHVPSCSTYTLEAVESHGALKGCWLGFKRVLRCNPWGTSGYDPVPDREAN